LVEHDNNKIILIANEDKMDPERFIKNKEKTIGYTLHFEQSFQEVFENFISTYGSNSCSYQIYIPKCILIWPEHFIKSLCMAKI